MIKKKSHINFRVMAGSLIYALFILLLLTIISSSLLLVRFYDKVLGNDFITSYQLSDNFTSALNYYCSGKYARLGENDGANLHIDENNTVILNKKAWGVFEILKIESKLNEKESTKIFLCGSKISRKEKIGLFLPDLGYSLNVCGASQVRGKSVVPGGQIKISKIQELATSKIPVINGDVLKSTNKFIDVDKRIIPHNYLEKVSSKLNDSIISFSGTLPHEVINSFENRTVVFTSNEDVVLRNNTLHGNIVVISSKSISIDSTSNINDVLIYAPNIVVNNYFVGSCQLIATDSVKVLEDCRLLYPSSISLISDQSKNGFIHIGKRTELNGDLYIDGGTDFYKKKLIVTKTASVYGQVICDGIFELNGSVTGCVYTKLFGYKSPTTYYQNYLNDALIDMNSLSDYYVSSVLISNSKSRAIIKCLK